MNEECDYISVIIKAHEYFRKAKEDTDEYEKRILDTIKNEPLSLTGLAHAMGYKGITAKLSRTVDMLV